MPARSPRRTGVLVVRAWLEDGRPADLRARITWTLDVDAHSRRVVTASGDDEVEELVRRWLDALLAGEGPATLR
jgi:hypothetical protein